MDYQPFKDAHCAYSLHYHFCFQTKFNRPIFTTQQNVETLSSSLIAICDNKDYHLLEHRIEANKLFCLVSLRPDHIIAEVCRVLKGNLSREFNLQFPELANSFKDRALWAQGYYVRSIGKASRKAAQQYIDNQGEHHGIRNKQAVEIMRWVNPKPYNLRAAHADFDLSYHLVLVATGRKDIFDEYVAPALFQQLASYSESEGFYIERMSLLSDHAHLLVKTTPTMSVKACVLGLMNDSWKFMSERYRGVLKATKGYDLWTGSFYIGTVGDRTTALIKSFLGTGRLIVSYCGLTSAAL